MNINIDDEFRSTKNSNVTITITHKYKINDVMYCWCRVNDHMVTYTEFEIIKQITDKFLEIKPKTVRKYYNLYKSSPGGLYYNTFEEALKRRALYQDSYITTNFIDVEEK